MSSFHINYICFAYWGFHIKNLVTDEKPWFAKKYSVTFSLFILLYLSCILSSFCLKVFFSYSSPSQVFYLCVCRWLSLCLFVCICDCLNVCLFDGLSFCRSLMDSLSLALLVFCHFSIKLEIDLISKLIRRTKQQIC